MVDASEKTKRPANSAFKQQRLPAWQPILTAGTVLPTFFVIGILFIPVGIGLLYFSDSVHEISKDYTNCIKKGSKSTNNPGGIPCSAVIQNRSSLTCECKPIKFRLKEAFTGRVYIYYALTNFYQNHRRYVRSRDDRQLLGHNLGDVSKDCEPFRTVKENGKEKFILPCGAIANSMFSDEIELWHNGARVGVEQKGIAWESDKNYKFRNPSWYKDAKDNCNHEMWKKYAKPPAWVKPLCELKDGLENEDFIVWMRTAALPKFRKLYRIVKNPDGLAAGNYSLHINYSFAVKEFDGTKSIIISTTSLLGGKNPFLGICYITVGTLCLILGVIFLFIHINYGKRNFVLPNEMSHNAGLTSSGTNEGISSAADAAAVAGPTPNVSTTSKRK